MSTRSGTQRTTTMTPRWGQRLLASLGVAALSLIGLVMPGSGPTPVVEATHAVGLSQGSYHNDADMSDPSTWSWAPPSTQNQSLLDDFYTEVRTGADGVNRLHAIWTRAGAEGTFGWSVEYTNAPVRWSSGPVATQVPQPDRSQGGEVIILEKKNNASSARICLYSSTSDYPGACTPVDFSGILHFEDGGLTAILDVALTTDVFGEPGCPPQIGSTGYVRSWTGAIDGGRTLKNWTAPAVQDNSAASTCPSLTVKKNVVSRAALTDQFTLSASMGTGSGLTDFGNVTTVGTATGVQEQILGPLLLDFDTLVTVSELVNSAANANAYDSTLTCTATDKFGNSTTWQPFNGVSQNGTSGSFTIPETVEHAHLVVTCIFSNSVKPATLTVEKKWNVDGVLYDGAAPTGLGMSASLLVDGTQSEWGSVLDGFVRGQSVSLSEVASIVTQPGCVLTGQTIEGTGLDGVQDFANGRALTLAEGANSFTVTNTVACTQELTLTKKIDLAGVTDEWAKAEPDQWKLFAGENEFPQGMATPLGVGDYVLSERPSAGTVNGAGMPASAFAGGEWSCAYVDGVEGSVALNGETLSVPRGRSIACEVTNTLQTGALRWKKTGEGLPLVGSEWTLTLQGVAGATVAARSQSDEFRVENLPVGIYTLHESTVPEGYVAHEDIDIVVTAGETNLSYAETPIDNAKIRADVLWSKGDAESGGLLAGSSWGVYAKESAELLATVTDCEGPSILECGAGTWDDRDPAVGQFRLERVEYGEYFLKEASAPAGYVPNPGAEYAFAVTANGVEVRVSGDGVSEGRIPNTKITGPVAWSKVDADNDLPLAGSSWDVYAKDAVTALGRVGDCVAATAEECGGGAWDDRDPTAGKFRLEKVEYGEYLLKEQAAPPGYVLESREYPFAVTTDGVLVTVHPENEGKIPNTKVTVPALPLTGGLGEDWILLLAGGVGGAALLIAGLAKSRARTRR